MKFEDNWAKPQGQKAAGCLWGKSNRLFSCEQCVAVVQVSDHGVLVMQLDSGLSFPATEYLSHIIHTQALQGKLLFIFI